ncbi:MAG: hypothetical protein IPO72_15605 [Saprospiraceae bacterium]|nr:hypothetical protein [Candidatus Vicinibacter affinis]MBK9642655.1 hypothetical protein [Candidatus Vicinibacter affinis]
MRIIIFVIFLSALSIFSNCTFRKINDVAISRPQCAILDSVLSNKDVSRIIGLDKAKEPYPYIRFFCEKSKVFLDCDGIYVTKDRIPVSYFIISKISYYLNTGQYRDLVIYDYKENKREIYISLIAAHFENQLEKEGVPFFEFTFKKKEAGFNIEKVLIKTIREQLPVPYYYK